MYTKLKFTHELEKEEKEKLQYNLYMERKVKNSPLSYFIKPEPMIATKEILEKVSEANYVAA